MTERIINVVLIVSGISLAIVIVVNSPAVQDILVPDWIHSPSEPAEPAPRIEGLSLERLGTREEEEAREAERLMRSRDAEAARATARIDARSVTADEYRQLSTGTTYREAVAIIGFRGEELSRVDLAGTTTIMYQWMNADGSNMNAMFQNDQLVQKAQFGLR